LSAAKLSLWSLLLVRRLDTIATMY
jgi:hypothetical protein